MIPVNPTDMALLFIAVACLMVVAGFAQYRIRAHTAASRVALTRIVLAIVGIAFGYAVAANSGAKGAMAPLAFLAGFGLVHVPAAIILFLKGWRREGRS